VLQFRRGDHFTCVVNFGDTPIALPVGDTVVVCSSTPLDDGLLPPDSAVWLVGAAVRR
jgi:alpha-glucosidase